MSSAAHMLLQAAGEGSALGPLLDAAGSLDLDARDEKGWTMLHHAAAHGSLQNAEALLARKANVDALNLNGGTPLHWCVMLVSCLAAASR